MEFSPKCSVLSPEWDEGIEEVNKSTGAAAEGQRGGPPLYLVLAGTWNFFPNITTIP